MPGLLFSLNQFPETNADACNAIARSAYELNTLFNEPNRLFVASNQFKDYPFRHWSRQQYSIVFEGLTYPFLIEEELDELFSFFISSGFDTERINDWIQHKDGEFNLLFLDQRLQQALLVNDRFGRLPLYFLQEGRRLALGREIAFVRQFKLIPTDDKLGWAQTLLFGYTLGTRTLWEKVERLKPNLQLHIDLINGRTLFRSYFKAPETSSKNINNQLITNVKESFNRALRNRIHTLKNPALSLSGGLDSRLIAAALASQQLTIPLISYRDAEKSAEMDVQVAVEIVEKLNYVNQYQIVDLKAVTAESIVELLQLKQGLNGAEMAFILPFLKFYRDQTFQMITGDGGDKTLDDLRPSIHLFSQQHLINQLIAKHSAFSINHVSHLLQLSPSVVYESIVECLKSYQSRSLEEQYIQFMIQERAMHWLFEGEDRNRSFIWTTTPYYNPHFFDLAFQIPMKEKAQGKFFLNLLPFFPGQLHTLKNPNWMAAPTEKYKVSVLFFRQKIKGYLPAFLKTQFAKNNHVIDQQSFMKSISDSPSDCPLFQSPDWKRLSDKEFPFSFWYRWLSLTNTSA
jgi:asparagine synthase (glutamine-hydrolysing)